MRPYYSQQLRPIRVRSPDYEVCAKLAIVVVKGTVELDMLSRSKRPGAIAAAAASNSACDSGYYSSERIRSEFAVMLLTSPGTFIPYNR